MGPAPSLHITWQEPMPLDAAIGQPGAGVFIIERAGEGEDAWMPAHVTIAADGFGSRIQLLMDDAQGLGSQPDWSAFRVRLGVLPVRPGHPADRAALHAISRDVAARIRGTEAGAGLAPSPEPTQRQQQLLQERDVQDTGAIPDYLSSRPRGE
jgi:hypothetical protein